MKDVLLTLTFRQNDTGGVGDRQHKGRIPNDWRSGLQVALPLSLERVYSRLLPSVCVFYAERTFSCVRVAPVSRPRGTRTTPLLPTSQNNAKYLLDNILLYGFVSRVALGVYSVCVCMCVPVCTVKRPCSGSIAKVFVVGEAQQA